MKLKNKILFVSLGFLLINIFFFTSSQEQDRITVGEEGVIEINEGISLNNLEKDCGVRRPCYIEMDYTKDPPEIKSAELLIKKDIETTTLNLNGINYTVGGGTKITINQFQGVIIEPKKGESETIIKEGLIECSISNSEKIIVKGRYAGNREIVIEGDQFKIDSRDYSIENLAGGETKVIMDTEGNIIGSKYARIHFGGLREGIILNTWEETTIKYGTEKNMNLKNNYVIFEENGEVTIQNIEAYFNGRYIKVGSGQIPLLERYSLTSLDNTKMTITNKRLDDSGVLTMDVKIEGPRGIIDNGQRIEINEKGKIYLLGQGENVRQTEILTKMKIKTANLDGSAQRNIYFDPENNDVSIGRSAGAVYEDLKDWVVKLISPEKDLIAEEEIPVREWSDEERNKFFDANCVNGEMKRDRKLRIICYDIIDSRPR